MRIFLSHSIASDDGPIASRMKAIAAAYETMVVLPDREGKRPAKSALRNSIRKADAVVALVTEGSFKNDWVNYELAVAKDLEKPIIALLESGLVDEKFELEKLGIPVVEFDRDDPLGHKINLHKAIESISCSESNPGRKGTDREVLIAILGVAVLILGLLVMGILLAQPGEQRHAS